MKIAKTTFLFCLITFVVNIEIMKALCEQLTHPFHKISNPNNLIFCLNWNRRLRF